MTSKFSRSALAAAAAVGASGLVAASASAAISIPTHLVNQPAVSGVTGITPESATLTGTVDTGGNPGSTFGLFAGQTLQWEPNNIVLTNSTAATITEYVDGIPDSGSQSTTQENGGFLSNMGNDNYSDVLFEYDPLSDYTANGDNPGPDTGYADEVDVPTTSGLSTTKATVGGYPAASAADNGETPLTPDTKYVYFIVQQAGITDDAEDVNTFNPASKTASTSVNPTYSCMPDTLASQTPPYSGYTTTGTLSGGVVSAGGPAQTTPQPEIQGPCLAFYGGSTNFYESPVGTFTTPPLGAVTFSKKATLSRDGATATVLGTNGSVDNTVGAITLTYEGKTVATGKFSAGPHASHTVNLNLTTAGKLAVAPVTTVTTVKVKSKGKTVTKKLTSTGAAKTVVAKVTYVNKDDQKLGTTSITL